jgi:hypothetical protein
MTTVIDFGPYLAARKAGNALPHEPRLSFEINIRGWPLTDVSWLADRMEEMGGERVAALMRQLVKEATP